MRVIGRWATSAVTMQSLRGHNMRSLLAFWTDESGTETLEWGLVCGLIVVGAIILTSIALSIVATRRERQLRGRDEEDEK